MSGSKDVGETVAQVRHDGGCRYVLTFWDTLVRYCDDGGLDIDNNAAERALRERQDARQITCSAHPMC
jgi:hypothetical protein